MMGYLRQNTKIVLWIVVVAFVVTIFAVWGMDLRTGSSKTDPSLLGRVNGIPITRVQYRNAYEQMMAQYRKMSPTGQLSYAQQQMVEDQIWDTIVMSILTEAKIKELGITVTNEEIVNFLRNTPPPEVQQYFPDDKGQFDYQAYLQALNNPEADWTSLENLARQRLPRLKLNQYLSSQIHIDADQVRQAYEESNTALTAQYVEFPIDDEDIKGYAPTDEEISTYYNEHIGDFTEDEKASLEIVVIDITPSQADREDVLYTLSEIRRKILDGADFGEMAKTYSERMTAETGGEAGWLRRDPDQPEIYDSLAVMADNELSEPFPSDGGYYLLKRLGLRTGEDGTVEFNALEIYRELQAGTKTFDSLSTVANTFREKADKIGLRSAAQEMGLEVKTPKPVFKDFPLEELGFVPALNKFAFNNKPGALSAVLRDEGHFYVCRLVERIPASPKPIEEVRNEISTRLTDDLKKSQAWTKADGFFRQTASLGFEKTAAAHKLAIQKPDTFQAADNLIPFGRRSLLAETALALTPGAVSPPIEMQGGYYVIQLISRSEVDEADLVKQTPGIFNKLFQEQLERYVTFWYDELKKNSKIEDYRDNL